MTNMSIRVTKEELDAHGQTSVALPGGGYLAWLGVFHELHCVKMLRQWSYREHYHPNITSHEHQHLMVHIGMCGQPCSHLLTFAKMKKQNEKQNEHKI